MDSRVLTRSVRDVDASYMSDSTRRSSQYWTSSGRNPFITARAKRSHGLYIIAIERVAIWLLAVRSYPDTWRRANRVLYLEGQSILDAPRPLPLHFTTNHVY